MDITIGHRSAAEKPALRFHLILQVTSNDADRSRARKRTAERSGTAINFPTIEPAVAEPIHRPFTLGELTNSSCENIVGSRSRTITNDDERHAVPVVHDNNCRVARVTTVKLFKKFRHQGCTIIV